MAYHSQLLDALMTLAGEPPASRDVEFIGADPVFPTPMRIGEVGAAAIAATAVQAARLWELRTGRRQRVRVAVDAAAAALRSSRYLRAEPSPGSQPPRPRPGGGRHGIYATRDGRWVFFQRLFQHHRDRITTLLDCEDTEDSIGAAVTHWDAQSLEDAAAAAGVSAGMARSTVEWDAHPQGQAVAGMPLFEVLRIGDGPALPLPTGSRPLSGIRVLDLTRVLAGPTCGRTLAEHGAEVLRVGTDRFPDDAIMLRDTGHGKRSTELDLTAREGVEQLQRLIRGADVFSQGYRPGSLAARGFSPEEVAGLRPGIVYVSISAYGAAGPWWDRRGFDSVVQVVSGLATEYPVAGRPRQVPVNVLDYGTGYLAAFGVMLALARRARDGGSYHVRVSLAQTGRWLASVPRVDPEPAFARPPDLSSERLAELTMTTETPYGRLRHLAPVAHMSDTPPRWDTPTVPLNYHPAAWTTTGT